MRNHVCWRSANVRKAMDTEALQTDPHYFLACHSPVEMKRAHTRSGQRRNVTVTQEELLQELLKPESTHVQMMVLGESGTGKSHLIRWMYLHCPQTEQRRVIMVPKSGTNLRRIVQSIIGDLQGEPFDGFRARLERATQAISPARARQELLAALAINVGPEGPLSAESWGDPAEQATHEDIIQQLPALLRDEAFQQPLLMGGGTVDLIAEHVTGSLERQYGEEWRAFAEADLLHEDWVVRQHQMGATASEIYTFVQQDPAIRAHVLEWLNANLPAAEQRLTGLGRDDLTQLVMDVREELARRGSELVLFIEDFAKTEGIELELLAALQVRPEQEGRHLCVLRSAVACTTGRYTKLDETVRTRVDSAVNLDVDYTGAESRRLAAFAARYLNAVRADESELRRWYADVTTTDGTAPDSPPVHCAGCTYQDDCHRIFPPAGDIGLYPFNRKALERLYGIASESSTFSPRDLLNRVLLPVLEMSKELQAGQFPPGRLLPPGEGQMDAATQADLRRQVPEGERERYRVLLELWADPSKIGSLHQPLREALGIDAGPPGEPEPGGDEEHRQGGQPPPPPLPPPSVPEQALSPRAALTIEGLNEWARGGEMSQAVLQDLRDHLFPVVGQYIDWDSEMLLQGDFRSNQAFRPAGINFVGQGPNATGKFQIVLPFNGWEPPEIAVALQAMVKHRHFRHWEFEGAEDGYLIYVNFLSDFSAYVVQRLREHFGEPGSQTLDPVRACVEVLTFGACLRGVLPKEPTPAQLVEAIMYDWSGQQQGPPQNCPPAWRQLHEAYCLHGAEVRGLLLARVGCTKGGSRGVQIVDAGEIVPCAVAYLGRGALSAGLPDDAPTLYDAVAKLRKKGDQLFATAVEAAVAEATVWEERVCKELGPELDCRQVADAIAQMMTEAGKVGMGVGEHTQSQRVLSLGKQFAELPMVSQMRAAQRLNTVETALQKLQLVAAEPFQRCLRLSGEYLTLADSTVETIRRRLATDLSQCEAQMKDAATAGEVEAQLLRVAALVSDLCGGVPDGD